VLICLNAAWRSGDSNAASWMPDQKAGILPNFFNAPPNTFERWMRDESGLERGNSLAVAGLPAAGLPTLIVTIG
jgi:hypothetical protein